MFNMLICQILLNLFSHSLIFNTSIVSHRKTMKSSLSDKVCLKCTESFSTQSFICRSILSGCAVLPAVFVHSHPLGTRRPGVKPWRTRHTRNTHHAIPWRMSPGEPPGASAWRKQGSHCPASAQLGCITPGSCH